jgi:penicillin amidase
MKMRCLSVLFFSLIVMGALSPHNLSVPIASAQAPAETQALRLAGLQRNVTVRRDERGIPYLEAANEQDLYFAQGYVMASDRLWQMDLLRRTARGELAEIFGKALLEEDKRHRTYGFARLSEQIATNLPNDEGRTMTEAYARGVNAFIASCDEKALPIEFRILRYKPREWTVADSVSISLLMDESLSTTWPADVLRAAFSDLPPEKFNRLFPEFSKLDTPVVGSDQMRANGANAKAANDLANQSASSAAISSREILQQAMMSEALMKRSLSRLGLDAEELAASNNWVISGKRTTSGKPLLANDPHLSPSVPSIWYLVHLSAPGLRVAGVTIPGFFGVIIGHNDRIAWGMTNLGPDVQDLYSEKFDSENPRRYLTPAGWQEADIRREEINVRKAPTDPATEAVALDVTVTRHGPVVLEKGGARYALRWTIFDPKIASLKTFYLLNRAKNWREFTAAVKTFSDATQNFVYADADGHIGYYGAGFIPMRKSGDGSRPYDGSKDDGEWTGYIPFDKLPHVFDPPSGMIVTANARIVGRDYPYHLTHGWSVPYRQKRINDLLAAKSKLTIDDFRAIQGDVYAIGGKMFAQEVVKLFGNHAGGDDKFKATLKLLAEWDGRVTADSKAALMIYAMRDLFFTHVLAGAVGEERARQYRWQNSQTTIDYLITERPNDWLPKGYANWQDYLRACESEARADLTKKLGADESKWKFGELAQIKFAHPLAAAPMIGEKFKIAPFPQQGNGYSGGLGPTVNVGPTVSMRMIVDLSNLDNSQHGITLGESGDPASPHYKDQLDDWRNVTPRVFPFTAEAVKKAAKQMLTLMP